MKIAILGFGSQGQSALEYWQDQGHEITVCDKNIGLQVPGGASTRRGENHLENLDDFDLIVRSPIVHPNDIVQANGEAILEKVTTVTNEFMRICPTKNIIGVTGTKGKGTTSTLIAEMLKAAGYRVHLGGNIGIPPLDLLKDDIKADDRVVLELANFQLIDLKYSPPVAVCVMVEPEHLDWHKDENEYFEAKKQLFRHQGPEDKAIYYAENEISREIASASPGMLLPYMSAPGAEVAAGKVVIQGEEICSISEIKLLGRHNWQNVCAATTAVWQIIQDKEVIREAIISFSGLPFRIEFRKKINGISYYNDSFSSAPGATIASINAVPGKKVVIIGGVERGSDLSELINSLRLNYEYIRKMVLIGASAHKLAEELEKAHIDNYILCETKNMDEIVRTASTQAQSGDSVILSPGFASFDMFKNFEDRGMKFNEAVNAL